MKKTFLKALGLFILLTAWASLFIDIEVGYVTGAILLAIFWSRGH